MTGVRNKAGTGRSVAVLAGVVVLLGGCTDLERAMGFGKSAPDEFAVVRHETLVIPPNFDLRPPQPGAPRPQEVPASELAQQALLGQSAHSSLPEKAAAKDTGMARTPGEQALLRDAGSDKSPSNIRDVVRIEAASEGVQDRSFTDALLFWQSDKQPTGQVLDPKAEMERLKKEGKAGPTNAPPSAAPAGGIVIERKKGGLFGNLF